MRSTWQSLNFYDLYSVIEISLSIIFVPWLCDIIKMRTIFFGSFLTIVNHSFTSRPAVFCAIEHECRSTTTGVCVRYTHTKCLNASLIVFTVGRLATVLRREAARITFITSWHLYTDTYAEAEIDNKISSPYSNTEWKENAPVPYLLRVQS